MSPAIEFLQVTHYPRGPGRYWHISHDAPGWDLVESELESMHRFEKPILTLQKKKEWEDSDLMMVNGGEGIYHIQIEEDDCWLQAYDPEGSDELVDVWLSDQGFSTERRYTWNLEDAGKIVRHYFETGEKHPGYRWD
jgi:hypothetical protein